MRRAPLATLIAALALALTGCSDEPGPSGLPSDAATPPATTAPPSSAPRTPPTAPVAVNEQTDEGAKAAATFFIQALEYFYNTGDPTVLQSATVPDCQSCGEVITNVGALYSAGGHMVTGKYEVSDVQISTNYPNGARRVDLSGIQPRRDQYDQNDVLIKAEDSVPLDLSVIAVVASGRWLVQEFGVGV